LLRCPPNQPRNTPRGQKFLSFERIKTFLHKALRLIARPFHHLIMTRTCTSIDQAIALDVAGVAEMLLLLPLYQRRRFCRATSRSISLPPAAVRWDQQYSCAHVVLLSHRRRCHSAAVRRRSAKAVAAAGSGRDDDGCQRSSPPHPVAASAAALLHRPPTRVPPLPSPPPRPPPPHPGTTTTQPTATVEGSSLDSFTQCMKQIFVS
jgi:hypothetical protein